MSGILKPMRTLSGDAFLRLDVISSSESMFILQGLINIFILISLTDKLIQI